MPDDLHLKLTQSSHARARASGSVATPQQGAPPPCVVVLGPPGGGADTTARTLELAGLAAPAGGGLAGFGDRVLSLLGGSWDRPPALAEGWERSARLRDIGRLAPAAFRLAFAGEGGPLVWSEPRTSLLLPFWREVIDRPIVGVVSWRDPLAVAAELVASGQASRAVALALFDRYVRSALEALRGLPVYVSNVEGLVADAGRWTADVTDLLREAGVKAHEPEPAELAALLAPYRGDDRRAAKKTKKESVDAGGALAMLPATRGLVETLEQLAGPHRSFDPPPLPPPDDWVEELLTARSDAAVTWGGLLQAARTVQTHILQERAEDASTADPTGHVRSHEPNAVEDRPAYRAWLEERGRRSRLPSREEHLHSPEPMVACTAPPEGRPRFSIVVPVWRPPMWVFERCVTSVLAQTYASFELCMCDDASGDPALTAALERFAAVDPRIKVTANAQNGGISSATNGALGLAEGEFVVLLDNDDELEPHALETMAKAIDANPLADVLYSDEDKTNEYGELFEPSCKPDWAPDTLLSCAYMCHLFVIRRSLLAEVGGFRSEFDGSQDYDLMLRSTERARDIVHVPDILYHWRIIAGSAAGDTAAKPYAYIAARRALEDAMLRRGEEATVRMETLPGLYDVRRRIRGEPLVSVIVPFKDEPALLTQCVEAMCEAPGYDRFEIVLVDNASSLPETAALLDQLSEHPRVTILEEPGPFNWASINNDAAAAARGDLLLFMNNDVEATTEGWLRPLVEHAQRPEVGAVGARLLYPDRTVQHAGLVLGMIAVAGHVMQDLPEDHPGYLAWAFITRNVTAVTGACMMTPRALFEQLGGFPADLPVAFNDLDYCLRLRQEGKLVVYTPLAELVHHRSHTRGETDDAVELPRFLERWGHVVAAGDPYYNPNLSYWRLECAMATRDEEEQWMAYRSKLLQAPAR